MYNTRYFPKVFGEEENEPLQTSAGVAGFQSLTNEVKFNFEFRGKPFLISMYLLILFQVNSFMKQSSSSFKEMTLQEVAMGFIEVANETMCRPIRNITQVYNIFKVHHFVAIYIQTNIKLDRYLCIKYSIKMSL